MDISVNGLKERNEGLKNGTNGHATTEPAYKQINEKLDHIARYLLKENEYKLQVIAEQRHQIETLKKELNQKSANLAEMKDQLQQSAQHMEGHRQLINKLLNDLEHFQNEIEWYKRTYERRSIWGVLKEKLTKRK